MNVRITYRNYDGNVTRQEVALFENLDADPCVAADVMADEIEETVAEYIDATHTDEESVQLTYWEIV